MWGSLFSLKWVKKKTVPKYLTGDYVFFMSYRIKVLVAIDGINGLWREADIRLDKKKFVSLILYSTIEVFIAPDKRG